MGDSVSGAPPKKITAKDIAEFLGSEIYGDNIEINFVKPLDDIVENSLAFSKNKVDGHLLADVAQVCLITKDIPDDPGSGTFILVENPRLAFARVLAEFFDKKDKQGIGKHSVISPSAKIGLGVTIGNNCTLGENVVIGDETVIRNNVVIADGVKIGAHCLIRSNCVIGEEGFGFETGDGTAPMRIPHFGSVQIGDFVEVGNFTAIARGTLKDTIVGSHVKIDNLVHIAHNCLIGENTLVIACAEVSGSAVVGKNCWLGVGCSIIQKVTIGDNCLVGMGAVVLKDVPSGAVVVGNPAKIIKMKK